MSAGQLICRFRGETWRFDRGWKQIKWAGYTVYIKIKMTGHVAIARYAGQMSQQQ
jgi:hypothetical protein